MSLRQDVLKSKIEDIEGRLRNARLNANGTSRNRTFQDEDKEKEKDDSDSDDLINVVSLPGTPSRTRASSPVRGASSRPLKGPLMLSGNKTDPLKAFPTELSQKIFARLSMKDLARCSLVSRKWGKSQTLNYVWFQHYRKENFHDDSLPPGKWTKRESKQNWRQVYLKEMKDRSPPSTPYYSRGGSGYHTPSGGGSISRSISANGGASGLGSGYQTPRELKEEQWRAEAETTRPGKVEMREMYKELGGRKSRAKVKLGSGGAAAKGGKGVRDRGGWEGGDWD
ncbi:hypothetical protein CPB83DRAFT_865426 [Crepidotus variabilis]|uniref:F-box domain-containing protein n=1 Tax=Crepidotus variabilis TaxID=179855 RepID=A0A9P6E2Y5_9AGAR|nr:hypothetical protein CPB83DRAFT_865426 [Crepidotus variabilis]